MHLLLAILVSSQLSLSPLVQPPILSAIGSAPTFRSVHGLVFSFSLTASCPLIRQCDPVVFEELKYLGDPQRIHYSDPPVVHYATSSSPPSFAEHAYVRMNDRTSGFTLDTEKWSYSSFQPQLKVFASFIPHTSRRFPAECADPRVCIRSFFVFTVHERDEEQLAVHVQA
ncbi:hypothetical protein BDN70DRAFT_897004 [Pholiota conissans]|uniref:Uncharacterized protein n=1 Tax=Pholiota conissans TaxID=109636 RepID=A0A9P6CYP1_9AGAR|nr:hypothetical protein BDN70DRAFT_897004 [Pholiota conissans]